MAPGVLDEWGYGSNAADRVGRAVFGIEGYVRGAGVQADLHGRLAVDLVAQDRAGVVVTPSHPGLQCPRAALHIEAFGLGQRDASPGAGELDRVLDDLEIQTAVRGERGTIHVRHGVAGAGALRKLIAVLNTIIVGVGIERIGSGGLLFSVSETVTIAEVLEVLVGVVGAVGVGVHQFRVQAGQVLVVIVESVTVGVGRTVAVEIADVLILPVVGNAVTVGINVLDRNRRIVPGGNHGCAHAQNAGVGPVSEPILRLGEVGRVGSVVIKAEVTDQPGLIAGQQRGCHACDLRNGPRCTPDANFVNLTDEALTDSRNHRAHTVGGALLEG